jgi:hypothetical protein
MLDAGEQEHVPFALAGEEERGCIHLNRQALRNFPKLKIASLY